MRVVALRINKSPFPEYRESLTWWPAYEHIDFTALDKLIIIRFADFFDVLVQQRNVWEIVFMRLCELCTYLIREQNGESGIA